jgi:hypothetical protein
MTNGELLSRTNDMGKDPPKDYAGERQEITEDAARHQAEPGAGQTAPEANPPDTTESHAVRAPTSKPAGTSPHPTVQTAPAPITVEEGNTYQTPNGPAKIVGVEQTGQRKVTYDVTLRGGKVVRFVRPMSLFQKFIIQPAEQPTEEATTPEVPPAAAVPTTEPALVYHTARGQVSIVEVELTGRRYVTYDLTDPDGTVRRFRRPMALFQRLVLRTPVEEEANPVATRTTADAINPAQPDEPAPDFGWPYRIVEVLSEELNAQWENLSEQFGTGDGFLTLHCWLSCGRLLPT